MLTINPLKTPLESTLEPTPENTGNYTGNYTGNLLENLRSYKNYLFQFEQRPFYFPLLKDNLIQKCKESNYQPFQLNTNLSLKKDDLKALKQVYLTLETKEKFLKRINEIPSQLLNPEHIALTGKLHIPFI
jgi:hypothetical protein